jgi:hypothetical protein
MQSHILHDAPGSPFCLEYGALMIRLERTILGPRIGLSNPLNQPGTFVSRWVVGATIGAAVVPNPYRLQAGNTDEATSFENHPMFHKVSLERSAGGDNGRFGAGKSSVRSTKPIVRSNL